MLILKIVLGFCLLLGGGEILVRGAVALATRLGISPMVIGLTLVGFGTSTPELVASLNAALAGVPGIAIGNVVGSNIANVLLILGLAAVLHPLVIHPDAFKRDMPVFILVTALLVFVCWSGEIGRITGVVFLVLLAAYTLTSYWLDTRRKDAPAQLHEAEAKERLQQHPSIAVALALTVGGISAVIFGADLLVDASVVLARSVGISETVIGLTLVAVGTSLPELVTTGMAAFRRHGDVAFGNIVGSNIFNVLGILGVTSLVRPLSVPPDLSALDLWAVGLVSLLLLVFARTGLRLERWEAGLFLVGYIVYTGLKITGAG